MRRIKNPWTHNPAYRCFGCCPDNAAGVKMTFYANGDEVVSVWKPEPQFQGWIDTLHGGIQAVMLDEICAWAVLNTLQTTGVTSKMETRYKKPVSTNDEYLILRAHVTERRRNFVTVEAAVYDSTGDCCTQAVCVYFTFPPAKALEMGFRGLELDSEDVDEQTLVAAVCQAE